MFFISKAPLNVRTEQNIDGAQGNSSREEFGRRQAGHRIEALFGGVASFVNRDLQAKGSDLPRIAGLAGPRDCGLIHDAFIPVNLVDFVDCVCNPSISIVPIGQYVAAAGRGSVALGISAAHNL